MRLRISTRSSSGGMTALSFSIDCPDGGALGFLLRHLPVDGGKLGILFGGLADQEAAMHLDQGGRRIRRRLELRGRIALRGQRGAQPGSVQLSRDSDRS